MVRGPLSIMKDRPLPHPASAAGGQQTYITLMENYIEYAKVPGIEQHNGHFRLPYIQFLEESL